MAHGMPAAATADACNLYVNELPADADDLFLYRTFAPFGAISSVPACPLCLTLSVCTCCCALAVLLRISCSSLPRAVWLMRADLVAMPFAQLACVPFRDRHESVPSLLLSILVCRTKEHWARMSGHMHANRCRCCAASTTQDVTRPDSYLPVRS